MAAFALLFLLSSVHITIDQDGGLSPAQVAVAVDQIRQIWSAAGVMVTASRPGEARPPDQAIISVRIVRFSTQPNSRGESTLAWVAVTEERMPAPAVFVSLPTMTAVLSHAEFAGYAVKRLTSVLRAELAGRAIGRAVAHELGHFLLQRAGHRGEGLMRRSYSPNDLVGDWLEPFQVPADERLNVRAEIETLTRAQHAFQDDR